MDNRPNHTLYVNNLNDRVKKLDLRRALYYLFTQYGKIIDIVALKTANMRGQAFVIFRDINSATGAMRDLQGFLFFDKPMRIHFARKDSSQIERLKGQSAEALKKREEEREKRRKKKAAQRAATAAQTTGGLSNGDSSSGNARNELESGSQPNSILFLSNLPQETTEEMLSMLFAQFTGFKEVRQVTGRKDIAFVEYDTEANAGSAKNAYEGFKLTPAHPIKIEYAKK